jgi:nicotinamide-nucleotide adenylyltransferase
MEEIALIIGRFQPFHKGHLYGIKYVYEKHKQFIIGIGSALSSHTLKNPFTAGERLKMIFLALDEADIPRKDYYVIPIPDTEVHTTWVSLVRTLVPEFHIVYTNEPLTKRLFKEAGYNVFSIPLYKRETFSGEEFRKRVIMNGNWAELIQESVAEYLLEKNLLQRIIDLSKTDKPHKKNGVLDKA